MLESTPNRVNSKHTAGDKQGHMKMCKTLSFKVNRRGNVIVFHFLDILNLKNVRINSIQFKR